MRYFGGKARISSDIVAVLSRVREPNQGYLEPFLGGGSVFSQMKNPKIGSDVVPELIEFWQAVQNGWVPPDNITKEEYEKAKEGQITGPLRAFIGFGCSFGGKWFGGYANTPGRNYALNAKNSTLKKRPGFLGAKIILKDFFDCDIRGSLIYCDPPYIGKTKPGTRTSFDSERFWEHVRYLSRCNQVFVSEIVAPSDFKEVWTKSIKADMDQKSRVEKLFTWGGVRA